MISSESKNINLVVTDQEKPQGRFFHSFTLVQNGEAILLGGTEGQMSAFSYSQEVYSVNLISQKWQKLALDPTNEEKKPLTIRQWHSAAYMKINLVMVFGGATLNELSESFGDHKELPNELYELKFQSTSSQYKWRTIECIGQQPKQRYGASMISVKNHLILSGGSWVSTVLNDVWTINMVNETQSWSKVNCQINPRIYGGITNIQSINQIEGSLDDVVIFGGFCGNVTKDYVLLKYDIEKQIWTVDSGVSVDSTILLEPRSFHTTLSFDSSIINIGGQNKEANDFSSKIDIFSLKSKKFLSLNLPLRLTHGAAVILNKKLYYYGGFTGSSADTEIVNPNHQILEIDISNELQLFKETKKTQPFNLHTLALQRSTSSKSQRSHKNSFEEEKQSDLENQEDSGLKLIPFKDGNLETTLVQSELSNQVKENTLENATAFLDLKLQKEFSHQLQVGSYIAFKQGGGSGGEKEEEQEIDKDQIVSEQDEIQVNEDPSAIHNVLLQEMLQPQKYRQSTINFPFKNNEVLDLIEQVKVIIAEQSSVLQLSGPYQIFGDIHGQYNDLMRLFFYHGSPYTDGENDDIKKYSYLFLGDFVDRGENSVDVMILLLCLKLRYPRQIYFIRGNHQDISTNVYMGLQQQCVARFNEDSYLESSIFQKMNSLFDLLPLAAVLENQFFCCHGGIGPNLVANYDKFKSLQRPIQRAGFKTATTEQKILNDVLWCDPAGEGDEGYSVNNERGGKGITCFGKDVLKQFLNDHDFKLMIRAHQCVPNGYQYFHDGLGITVFSATNYCGDQGNSGAILILQPHQKVYTILPKIITPKPKNADQKWNHSVNLEHPESPYSMKHPLK